jgi:DNA-binding IscR family transcriptional regulator
MILSQICNYALCAAFYVTTQEHRKLGPIQEVTQKLQIFFNFLTKIFQSPNQAKIMSSQTRSTGDMALAREPKLIKFGDIFFTVNESELIRNWLIGQYICNRGNPYPWNEKQGEIKEELQNIFENNTLKIIAVRMKR